MSNDSVLEHEDTVFHYTKMHTAIEHILYGKCLRFSKSADTHDPREYKEWNFSVSFIDKIDKDIANDTSMLTVEVYQKLEKIMRSEYKLACFCSNRLATLSDTDSDSFLNNQTKRHGYDRLRMWSQYADGFRGVVIAFSAAALMKQLRKLLGQEVFIFSNHVNYVNNLYAKDLPILMLNGNELREKGTDICANDYVKKNIENIFFIKDIDYRDEIEYRIVVHDPDDKLEYLDISNCVKAVILGDRFPLVYDKAIEDLCKELGVECKRTLWFRSKLLIG